MEVDWWVSCHAVLRDLCAPDMTDANECTAPCYFAILGCRRRRWTFGALMFEMLTGMPPFTAGSIQQLLHVIVHNPLVIPDMIRAKSQLAADAIEQLLQKVRAP